jgi:hypothetical protein
MTQQRAHDPVEGRLERLRDRFRDFRGGVQGFLEHVEHSTGAWRGARPRVHWVPKQSRRRLGEALRVPAAQRDAVLRERGPAMFHERYAPLLAEP